MVAHGRSGFREGSQEFLIPSGLVTIASTPSGIFLTAGLPEPVLSIEIFASKSIADSISEHIFFKYFLLTDPLYMTGAFALWNVLCTLQVTLRKLNFINILHKVSIHPYHMRLLKVAHLLEYS